jgi:hypothetical protein
MEPKIFGGVPADAPPSFVYQSVVGVAQQHQVIEVGAATVSPVHDVVGLHPLPALTSGKPAPAIAVTEQPGDRAGYRPASASDPHHSTSRVENPLDPRIAGQASDRVRAEALP